MVFLNLERAGALIEHLGIVFLQGLFGDGSCLRAQPAAWIPIPLLCDAAAMRGGKEAWFSINIFPRAS